MKRRYGFFRCKGCNSRWESSHVYCDDRTDQPIASYTQQCKKCNTACLPYKWEPMTCSICGLQEDCACTRADKAARHVDPNKPHRADLCAKCRSGNLCTYASPSSANAVARAPTVKKRAASSRLVYSASSSPTQTYAESYGGSYGAASYVARMPTVEKRESSCTII